MKAWSPLPREFYLPSARLVAPALLGHWLVRRTQAGLCGGRIVEVEAYLSQDDPACHAAPGPTPRNRVMFGEPGHAYVYLIYGLHYCVNAVCRPADIGEAVLIRAIDASLGAPLLHGRRSARTITGLTNGPAKLCEAMEIDRTLDGADLCNPEGRLFIAKNLQAEKWRATTGPVTVGRRVGLTKAAELPLRFYLEGSPFVSSRPARS